MGEKEVLTRRRKQSVAFTPPTCCGAMVRNGRVVDGGQPPDLQW
jgi:hypothetical protein